MNVQHQVSLIARQMIGELPMRDGSEVTVAGIREDVKNFDQFDLAAIRREISLLKPTHSGHAAMRVVAMRAIDAELMQRAPDGVGANVSLAPEPVGMNGKQVELVRNVLSIAIGTARKDASNGGAAFSYYSGKADAYQHALDLIDNIRVSKVRTADEIKEELRNEPRGLGLLND